MAFPQIKAKRIPPVPTDWRALTTEQDKLEAKRQTDAVSLIGIKVIFGIATFVMGAVVNGGEGVLLTLGLTIAIPWIFTWAIRHNLSEVNLEKVVTERLDTQQKRRETEENSSVSAATKIVETIFSQQRPNLKTLNELFIQIENSLNQAQRFYAERAYSPFWDSIEYAFELLKQFENCVNLTNRAAKVYYANLEGREHTFPRFPLRSEDLPNPDALMKRLTERIAEAQRDFQFSSIFEQRRTTSAIVAGFRNTQEAISSMRNDIVNSLSDLQGSLESGLENISSSIQDGFADMAERHEQSAAELRETLDGRAKETSERDAKHQDFAEGALDNIQNRRKPRLGETKEPFRGS